MKKLSLNCFYILIITLPCGLFAQNNESNDILSQKYRNASLNYSIRGNFISAINVIDSAIKLSTNTGELFLERAINKTKSHNYNKEQILADYDSATILDPTNPLIYRQRGIYYASIKMYKEAISDLEFAKKIHSDKATNQIIFKTKKESNLYTDKELLTAFNQIYGNKPLSIQDRIERAQLLSQNEYSMEAIKEYDTIIAAQPTVAVNYSKRARLNRSLKLYKESMNDYNSAIALNLKDASLYFMRGLLKAEMFQYKEAIKDYDTALVYDSTIQNVYFNRALDNLILKNNKAAIADNNKLISMNHRYTNAYINRAIAERRIGDFVHCFQEYDTIFKFWPLYSLGLSNLAWTYFFLGDTINGRFFLNKLLLTNPKFKAAHQREAMVLYNNAYYDECRNKATYIANNYKELEFDYFQRGNAENKLGNYEDAIEDYLKMLTACKNNPDVMSSDHTMVEVMANCSIAESKIHEGKLKEAIESCRKAILIDSNYLQAYNTLGLAYYLAGNYKKAIEICDDLLMHKKTENYYQPLYDYKEDAEKAHNGNKIALKIIQWLSPRDNINDSYKGTLYVAGQQELILKFRISSESPISKNEIVLFQDMDKITPSNSKLVETNISCFGAKHVYDYSVRIKLPGHICTYRLITHDKASQLLTVSPDKYPPYNPQDLQLYTWNGFAE